MENTYTTRRISYSLISFTSVLVAVAMILGFIVGRVSVTAATTSMTSMPPLDDHPMILDSVAPSLVYFPSNSGPVFAAQPQTATAGWLNRYASGKWYAVHFATTPAGPVIDDTIELQMR